MVDTASGCSQPRRRDVAGRRGHRPRGVERHLVRAGREQALKGKASPIPAWRALAVVAKRRIGPSSHPRAAFVRRDDELRLLKELFDATSREQKSRLLTVIGQAGIGKSRLASELEKYLDGVVDTAYGTRTLTVVRRGDQLLGLGRDGPTPRGDRGG